LNALAQISQDVADVCIKGGRKIDSWAIYGGERKVAEQKSGVVIGTSRVTTTTTHSIRFILV
jgi:hypothetical protein